MYNKLVSDVLTSHVTYYSEVMYRLYLISDDYVTSLTASVV
jgi:hypothetical protein